VWIRPRQSDPTDQGNRITQGQTHHTGILNPLHPIHPPIHFLRAFPSHPQPTAHNTTHNVSHGPYLANFFLTALRRRRDCVWVVSCAHLLRRMAQGSSSSSV
jgi:hypothetical protein